MEAEQDIELGLAKLRYEVGRIVNRKKRRGVIRNELWSRQRKRRRIEEEDKEDEREILENTKS